MADTDNKILTGAIVPTLKTYIDTKASTSALTGGTVVPKKATDADTVDGEHASAFAHLDADASFGNVTSSGYIGRADDSGILEIYGGTSWDTSAGFALRGKGADVDEPGDLLMHAVNADGTEANSAYLNSYGFNLMSGNYYINGKGVAPTSTFISGALGNCVNGNSRIYGQVSAVFSGGFVTLYVSCRMIRGSSIVEEYAWGINRDLLGVYDSRFSSVTPVIGGNMIIMSGDSAGIVTELTNYGTYWEVDGQFWVPSRIYDTSGSRGRWSPKSFSDNDWIIGTMFGTY